MNALHTLSSCEREPARITFDNGVINPSSRLPRSKETAKETSAVVPTVNRP